MARNIRFVEGTQADVPPSAKKIGGGELKALEQVFRSHIVEEKHKVAGPADKQPCHIIACVVTDEGVTCWYHCVKH